MDKAEIYKLIQDEALSRYQNRFYREGETPKALGWGCREDQIIRFENLCKHIDFSHCSIMDLGCGFADFYGYLKQKNIPCKYIGVDIIPEFIECCKDKYQDAEFLRGNILIDYDTLPCADYVISTGTLNLKQKLMENLEYTEEFMCQAYKKANIGLSIDFLSTHTTPEYAKEDFVYYHSPTEIIDLAFKYSQNIELIHDYQPIPQKEFMLYMGK